MPGYCTPDEVSIGNITFPRNFGNLNQAKQSYIDSAYQEIQVELGKRYKLPLNPDPSLTPESFAYQYLKKVNRFLAIGRIVIDAANGGEDNSLNSYGYYHIKMANDALAAIVNGTIDLEFELKESITEGTNGPLIDNRDQGSFVDLFYNQSVGMEQDATQIYPARPILWP